MGRGCSSHNLVLSNENWSIDRDWDRNPRAYDPEAKKKVSVAREIEFSGLNGIMECQDRLPTKAICETCAIYTSV